MSGVEPSASVAEAVRALVLHVVTHVADPETTSPTGWRWRQPVWRSSRVAIRWLVSTTRSPARSSMGATDRWWWPTPPSP